MRRITPMNDKPKLSELRRNYGEKALNESEMCADPIQQFECWFQEVLTQGFDDPTAMVLSTVDTSGLPDSRVLLLKGIESEGFLFYTNYHSAKGLQLEQNPHAAMNFYWPSMCRQVRVRGRIIRISSTQSAAYFSSRPRASQISAIASLQSQAIPSRMFLEMACHTVAQQYTHQVIPCPSHWGGYLLLPDYIEFWQGRDDRLHDRVMYTRCNKDQKSDMNVECAWSLSRLAP